MAITEHNEAIDYLKKSPVSERNPHYREALFSVKYNQLDFEEATLLSSIYFKLKDISLRNCILMSLFYCNNFDLKKFFFDAYKKERYLDMKLAAIRGYANYATEQEVDELMNNFVKILKKRPENTPYNYQEYEFIRSACGLPFLTKKYGYSCFITALEQEEKQYSNMPDAFKGHYTFDEDGNVIKLRDTDEVKKMMDDFFASKRSK